MKKLLFFLLFVPLVSLSQSRTDLIRLIANRIPGAKVSSGNITIRGGTFVMWDIDGMLYETPPPMDASQIVYLNALSSLAETNKYGQQGAAGVIVIRTQKTGKESTNSINLWDVPPPLSKEERKAFIKKEKKLKFFSLSMISL